MFWPKVVCDGCNAKVRTSRSIYYRSARFCCDACRDQWAQANPPLVAKGDPSRLRRDLTTTAEAALAELQACGGYVRRSRTSAAISRGVAAVAAEALPLAKMINNINQRHAIEALNDAKMRFVQHASLTMPLLNGLGYAEQARVLETTDFAGAYSLSTFQRVAEALESALDRAAAEA